MWRPLASLAISHVRPSANRSQTHFHCPYDLRNASKQHGRIQINSAAFQNALAFVCVRAYVDDMHARACTHTRAHTHTHSGARAHIHYYMHAACMRTSPT